MGKLILDDGLGQKSKVRILRYLSKVTGGATGRRIATDIHMSPWACHKALHDLYNQGILSMRRVGNTYLSDLNRKNYLVTDMLLPLFEKERNLFKIALEEIIKNVHVEGISIILFGSVSRGEEEPLSDIDLLIIVDSEEGKSKMEEFFEMQNEAFISRFGNILSPFLLR
jgi:predicted nucleotidyltransferase